MLKRRIEVEAEKAKGVETAFNNIKSSTGIQDVHEIVDKFLNRESIHEELVKTVQDSEKKLE